MKRRIFLKNGGTAMIGVSVGNRMAGQHENRNQINNKYMISQRMNSFDVPHKGIRNGLSQLSLEASRTDYENKDEVKHLFNLGREVFEILTTHANDENDVSLKALEEKLKGASNHDIEEHIRIHVAQSKLENLLQQIYEASEMGENVSEKGQEFYSLLSDFHANYLQHMAEEERETQVLLWQHFTDEELAQHRAEIMKKLKPDTLLLWFKFIIPAQCHKERVGLLAGFKAMAPNDFFQKAMSTIESVLSPNEWTQLSESLK